ncbi:unnamed protein product [Dracunculus medinensis]|uniref:SH3 domain-containing protein n=1 Tax=Dracunculus medinensis TaxID=318479 RepID=A0A0N4UB14_DRAME|nr:unnamed protein product [Dracunculus medinensis]
MPRGTIKCATNCGIGVAIALYDNIAEWSNELDFKRNELLRVIDERPCFNSNKTDTGWWYCVNAKGKSGFAPANRLYLFHRFKKHNIEKISTTSCAILFIQKRENSL